MANPELVRSVSPDLSEVPRRVALSRQHLSVGSDENEGSCLSSSVPRAITKEELNHLKKIQALEKSKKFLMETPSQRNNRQFKTKIGLFRRVESVDENIQRRGFLSASMPRITNRTAVDDFGMERLGKIELDILDQEETGPTMLRPRSASLHATTSNLSPNFKKRFARTPSKGRPSSARSGGRKFGKVDIQEQEASTQKVDNTFAQIKNQLAQFSEEDQEFQQRLDRLSEEITELLNAQKKAHIHLPSRSSSNNLRKATKSTSILDFGADQPQKAHSSEPTPNAKTVSVTIPTLTLSYSTSSEVDILCGCKDGGDEAKGEALEALSIENEGLSRTDHEFNTFNGTTKSKRLSLGSDFFACVVTETGVHDIDHTQNSSASSFGEDVDDVFVTES